MEKYNFILSLVYLPHIISVHINVISPRFNRITLEFFIIDNYLSINILHTYIATAIFNGDICTRFYVISLYNHGSACLIGGKQTPCFSHNEKKKLPYQTTHEGEQI